MATRRRGGRQLEIEAIAFKKRQAAMHARIRGKTWDQVAEEAGYADAGTACRAVREYFRTYPHEDADELREQENVKLDYLEQSTLQYIEQEHVLVASSGVVATRRIGILTDEDGRPIFDGKGAPIYRTEEVRDHEPTLRGNKMLLDIYARRARLNGLDIPVTASEQDTGEEDASVVLLMEQFVVVPDGLTATATDVGGAAPIDDEEYDSAEEQAELADADS